MDGVVISVQELVESISAAFRTSPMEVGIILGLIVLLAGVLVGYSVHSRRVERRRRAELEEERYLRIKQERGLGAGEEVLIERLASHLEAPMKRYLLLRNKAIFNSCARELVDEEPDLSDAVSALRVRLGFQDARPDEAVASTTEIPVNGSVLLVTEEHGSIGGSVVAQDEQAVVVRPSSGVGPFREGEQITLLYHNRAGVFSFRSSVLAVAEGTVCVDHSEYPQKLQRRRYYRQPVQRPAYIRPAGSEEDHDETQFIEIGGGGASLVNPYGKYSPGDDIEISFSPNADVSLSVAATVVRTSRGGDVIHVRYQHLRESNRDRIYRLIFRD